MKKTLLKNILFMGLIAFMPLALVATEYNEKTLIEKSKKHVLNQLKDPDSAKFRNIYVIDKSLVCGEVNAKNSYGGYNGFTFYYTLVMADNGQLETVLRNPDGKYNIGGVLCKQITLEELIEKGRKK